MRNSGKDKQVAPESSSRCRELVARSVNEKLVRLPMILGILGDLRKPPVPAAGDPELEAGCSRAMTAILAELARLEPAGTEGRAGKEEKKAFVWFRDRKVHELLDPDQLARLESFVARLLPA